MNENIVTESFTAISYYIIYIAGEFYPQIFACVLISLAQPIILYSWAVHAGIFTYFNYSNHMMVASYTGLYEKGDVEHINVFGLVL